MGKLADTLAEFRSNPEFQRITQEIQKRQAEMDEFWKELDTKFPLKDGRIWAITVSGTISAFSPIEDPEMT